MGELTVGDEYNVAIERDWARMAGPGSFFSGAERVAIAREARRERIGDQARTGEVAAVVAEAARAVSTRAHQIRREWVDQLVERGLDRCAYVEIIGVVSRLEAIDGFEFGVGRPLRQLPATHHGEPTGVTDSTAADNGAWVPTVGPPSAPVALSAVPDDHAALHEIHGAFFITNEQIPDFGLVRDLIRPQMEMVAARTSLVNECFY
jgi:hypothetical protein